jgi:hypothetical protein
MPEDGTEKLTKIRKYSMCYKQKMGHSALFSSCLFSIHMRDFSILYMETTIVLNSGAEEGVRNPGLSSMKVHGAVACETPVCELLNSSKIRSIKLPNAHGCTVRRVFTTFRILEISYISNVFFCFVYHSKMDQILRNYKKFFYAYLYKIPRYFRNSVTCYTNFLNDSAQTTFSTHIRARG